ncbi:HAD hydrolase-like protein, partial [bacterium]|nr:HAD hydrolase-like protein [bacterium]
MHLLIFDIDGTLATFAGITRVAFNQTFEHMFGQPGPWGQVLPHGKTDRAILRECLDVVKVNGNFDAMFSKFLDIYLHNLKVALQNADKPKLMPGVRELLERLAPSNTVCLALGTGNIERAARMKLRHLDVESFFPVGGFGEFTEERSDLLADAVENATRYFHCTFPSENTWVIGDTTYDIEGAQALGLRALAVATGGLFSSDDLRRAKPD